MAGVSKLVMSGFGKIFETNDKGSIETSVKNQFPPPIDLLFAKETGSSTQLSVTGNIGDKTITVQDSTGFLLGNTVGIFSSSGRFYFSTQFAPVGNVIGLAVPLDFAFESGSDVVAFTTNLAVNGSVTPQIFQVGFPGCPCIGEIIDITRFNGYLEDATAMDDALFGGIPALSEGIVLRKNGTEVRNIWDAKTNGRLALISAGDFDYTIKAPAGKFGARFRNTFNGREKHDSVIRLEVGEKLELIVQDNLTGLDIFEIMAQGYLIT